MARIALFGGAFDPFHNGHLAVCTSVCDFLRPDRLILIPSGRAPHKNGYGASFDDRYRMLLLALEGTGWAVSDYENRRKEISYSATTVENFAALYPEDELFFVVGADSYRDFYKWYRPDRIIAKATPAVYPRDGIEIRPPAVRLPAPEVDLSSTVIRELLGVGKSVEKYVPGAVGRYITEHKLYV